MATALNRCFPWGYLLTSICGALSLLNPPGPVWGSGVVTNCSEASLRAAMAGGGAVTIACDGRITLAGTLAVGANTTIDGVGHAITISGNGSVQVFTVATNVSLTLRNVTVADGVSLGVLTYYTFLPGAGAAVGNAGHLEVIGCLFSNNWAGGASAGRDKAYPGTPGLGGAIYNLGELLVSNSVFISNCATGGVGGADQANGGRGWPGGEARGGAIYSLGTASISCSQFLSNSITGGVGGDGQHGDSYDSGGWGGAGGVAEGGAVYSRSWLAIENCWLTLNLAKGGAAGSPGGPGFVGPGGGAGAPGAPGNFGGRANGGGIYSEGNTAVVACCLSSNVVAGGRGGAGGEGMRASFAVAGAGGNGGEGGWGLGAAMACYSGTFSVTNSTLSGNTAVGGAGGAGGNAGSVNQSVPGQGNDGGNGGNGGGAGGAVFQTNAAVSLVSCTIAGGGVQGGAAGAAGAASCGYRGGCGVGGVIGTNGVQLATALLNRAALPAQMQVTNSILAGGYGGPNCSGIISDGGHNLCSDGSAQFTAGSSLNNTDPKLGSLAANGGPTPTIALMPDSPAVDAGVLMPGAAQDQRGVPRPYGAAPDIGAYEWNASSFYTNFRLSAPSFSAGAWHLSGSGPTGAVVRLQASPNLVSWSGVATNRTDNRGFVDLLDPAEEKWGKFYRLVSP